jgi:hypothetical protein
VALRKGHLPFACEGSQELLPLSRARAFDFHPYWGTGRATSRRVALGYQFDPTTFVFYSPMTDSAGELLEEGRIELDIDPSRTSKNPLDDFGRRGGSLRVPHDPAVPLFCMEASQSPERAVRECCLGEWMLGRVALGDPRWGGHKGSGGIPMCEGGGWGAGEPITRYRRLWLNCG